MTFGNGVASDYGYRADNRCLECLRSQAATGAPFQNLSYGYDKVGNILTLGNDVGLSTPSGFGGPVEQNFGYNGLYRLTSASGTFQERPNVANRYTLAMTYDIIHNIAGKVQTDVLDRNGAEHVQPGTNYIFEYRYTDSQPHAPTHIGERAFFYDANGNQAGWASDISGQRRRYTWEETRDSQAFRRTGCRK